MRYNRNLSQWRAQFSDAASAIHNERNRVFEKGQVHMVTRIRAGGTEGLRELALELCRRGVYSSKISPCTVEHMIMVRLHRQDWEQRSWHRFITDTVGRDWLRPDVKKRKAV